MSIATDVSRIKGNITAALAAIADKGVTVPDGSTSDALASLIASIEASEGEGTFSTGTITVAEETIAADIIVNHNMGVIPNRLIWFLTAPTVSKLTAKFAILALYCDEFCSVTIGNASSSLTSSHRYGIISKTISNLQKTETEIHLSNGLSIHGGYIPAGYTVTWFVWG